MNELTQIFQKATQRGARMQIMRRWMREYPYGNGFGNYRCWDHFLKTYPEAVNWFDEDGVPK